jgi:hypothetical protein
MQPEVSDAQLEQADDGGVCISEGQRRVHMRSEAGAILVVAPALTFIATRPRALNTYEKGALLSIAALTLALDGSLYRRMAKRNGRKKQSKKKRRVGRGPIRLA